MTQIETKGGMEDLPLPDSEELTQLVTGREARAAYRWLYEHRDNPQPMSAWVERSREVFGKTNSNTGRRLRDLYAFFEVQRFKQPGSGEWVYKLTGRKEVVIDASPISKRLEAEVYAVKGRFCRMCGIEPGNGVTLQIDHIVPREWGGLTVLDNLEPLCAPHNHGKKAFYSTFDEVGPVISHAKSFDDPWTRIGELLKGFFAAGKPCPVELVAMVASETHKGDPKKRLRELRFVLGWDIDSSRKKDKDGITQVMYFLKSTAPDWPEEGAPEAVRRYERERKQRQRSRDTQEQEDE